MNTLDAIIAFCILLTSFATLLGIINYEKTQLESAFNLVKAKTEAVKCATIIDSIFANSSLEYSDEMSCIVKENEITYSINGQINNAQSIAKVESQNNLKVETNEHYTN